MEIKAGVLAFGFRKNAEADKTTPAVNVLDLLSNGARYFDTEKTLLLITREQFAKMSNGTVLYSISGKKVIRGRDAINSDGIGNLLAFGVPLREKPMSGMHPSSEYLDHLIKFGARYPDDEHNLLQITPNQFRSLPEGAELDCIDGTTAVKGKDYIDDDTRAGLLAYGFKVKK